MPRHLPLIALLAAGCHTDPPPADPATLFGSAARADTVTVYEGLPHQGNETKLFTAEKASKPWVDRDGYLFYPAPLPLTPEQTAAIRALLADPATFEPFKGEKKCGGFHPDYLAEFAGPKGTVCAHVCFGCGEVKWFGTAGVARYDMAGGTRGQLTALLTPLRVNRPKPTDD